MTKKKKILKNKNSVLAYIIFILYVNNFVNHKQGWKTFTNRCMFVCNCVKVKKKKIKGGDEKEKQVKLINTNEEKKGNTY